MIGPGCAGSIFGFPRPTNERKDSSDFTKTVGSLTLTLSLKWLLLASAMVNLHCQLTRLRSTQGLRDAHFRCV